jgi:hypothetical protein
MAFNPFHWFRKHQKASIAGLTIMTMIVFIFSFGRGDLFEQGLRWLGSDRRAGETVTTLYGKKVTEGQLDQLARQRKLASDFLFEVIWGAHARVVKDLLDKELKADNPDNAAVRAIAERSSRFRLQGVEDDLRELQLIASRDSFKNDPDRMKVLDQLATVLGFQAWQMANLRAILPTLQTGGRILPSIPYFGGGTRYEDLLDFLVWKQQADRLGITLTEADVRAEVTREAAGNEVFDAKRLADSKLVKGFLRGRGNVTPNDLLEALRQEFRVVMAQGLLLGQEPGVRAFRSQLALASPAAASPDEFLRYYREQQTRLNVKMLTVPVEKFTAQVKEEPTAAELRARFAKYRDQEPAPDRREPGFKQPRRVAVEWVSASSEDPHYKAEARKLMKLNDDRTLAAQRLTAGALVGHIGAGPAGYLASTYFAAAYDPVGQLYGKQFEAWETWFNPIAAPRSLLDGSKVDRAFDVHLLRAPAEAAGFAGLVVGNSLVRGSPLGPVLAVRLASTRDTRDILGVAGASLLGQGTAAAGMPAIGNLAVAFSLSASRLPALPSLEKLRPNLLAAVEEEKAQYLLQKNLATFTEELGKKKGRPNEAREYIKKAVKEFHLEHQAMPRPMTQVELEEALKRRKDVGLAGLRAAFGQENDRQQTARFLGQFFPQQTGVFEPVPMFSPTEQKRTFYYWRFQDLPARARDFVEVKAEVRAAWKLEKARQLARRTARELEDRINQSQGPDRLRDAETLLSEQKLGPVFELRRVMPLLPPERETLPRVRTEYRPYSVPEDQAELFPYPPADLARQLLVLERPGDAMVIADRPERNFYVAVLLDREEPSLKSFVSLYGRTPNRDTLYTLFTQERRAEFQRKVLDQLRRESRAKLDNDGRFEIPEEIRRRESRSSEEE